MLRARLLTLLVSTIIISQAAVAAGSKAVTNPYMDKISNRYTMCAAYFTIAYRAQASANKMDVANKYKQMYTIAMKTAFSTEQQARNDGMSRTVISTRVDKYRFDMFERTGDNYSKMPKLTAQYDSYCKQAIENPEKFINSVINGTNK